MVAVASMLGIDADVMLVFEADMILAAFRSCESFSHADLRRFNFGLPIFAAFFGG